MINVTSDIHVTPFIAWSTYTACTLHFKEDSSYDAFKFNFKGPRLSREKFEVHKLRYTFEKLAREVSDRNILIEYFVSNIINGSPWIHDMNWDVHSKWCGLLQRFDYDFKTDLNKINAVNYDDLFVCSGAEIPSLYQSYLCGDIRLNSVAAINIITPFTTRINKSVNDPLKIVQNVSKTIERYGQCIQSCLNKHTIRTILLDRFTN